MESTSLQDVRGKGKEESLESVAEQQSKINSKDAEQESTKKGKEEEPIAEEHYKIEDKGDLKKLLAVLARLPQKKRKRGKMEGNASQDLKGKGKEEHISEEQRVREGKNAEQVLKDKDKEAEELIAEDRELELLLDMCRRKDYSCSAKYAQNFLVKNDNKIFSALKAIMEDINEREARIEASGRISLAREKVLLRNWAPTRNQTREEYVWFMETRDQMVLEFDELGWVSGLGQDILEEPESERERLYQMERDEAAYRNKRVDFIVGYFDVRKKRSINADLVAFQVRMMQFDGIYSNHWNAKTPVAKAPGFSGRGHVLESLGYPVNIGPEMPESYQLAGAQAVAGSSKQKNPPNVARKGIKDDDTSNVESGSSKLTRSMNAVNIEEVVLPQGDDQDATIKKLQAESDEQEEKIRVLKEVVAQKSRDLLAKGRPLQNENIEPKKNMGKTKSKKVQVSPGKQGEPSTSLSSKVAKKGDALEAQRARALDEIISYDQSTRHLHDRLFESLVNIVGEVVISRNDFVTLSAEDFKHFQEIHEGTNQDFARTIIAFAAGSTALAVALWEAMKIWIRGYLMQKGMAFDDIEQKHLDSEVCRFTLHFYHKNCRD